MINNTKLGPGRDYLFMLGLYPLSIYVGGNIGIIKLFFFSVFLRISRLSFYVLVMIVIHRIILCINSPYHFILRRDIAIIALYFVVLVIIHVILCEDYNNYCFIRIQYKKKKGSSKVPRN